MANLLLSLAEAPLKCQKCSAVEWVRFSRTIACTMCNADNTPTERYSELRNQIDATYLCVCDNYWTMTHNIERPCRSEVCRGKMRAMMPHELTEWTPVGAQCCGTVRWASQGDIGSELTCATCTGVVRATRRIGVRQLAVLKAIERKAGSAHVPLESFGPIFFCSTLPASQNSRSRTPKVVQKSTQPALNNPFDILFAAEDE